MPQRILYFAAFFYCVWSFCGGFCPIFPRNTDKVIADFLINERKGSNAVKNKIKNSDNYELSLTLVLKNLDLTYKGEHRVCLLLFPLKGSHLRKQAIFIL